MNPREWDNTGTMVCWHRRYTLGDEQPSCTPSEYLADLPEGTIILPLYLYDHSGISMSTSLSYPYNDPWDAGQVGIIYATPEKIKSEEVSEEQIRKNMESEVDVYDKFLRNDVYGFILEEDPEHCEACDRDKEPEHIDSCFGFFGTDWQSNGLAEHLPSEVLPLLNQAEIELEA
jgi:hypothetical protein